ncbi:GNAT family protein [Streptomyces sp900116325]|uniref:GNAT family N-acetyltransferase n=1 Tax=Streptomyces sp. 900116325 TaxID=3154295 RepID=UPI003321A4D1
MSPAYTGGVGEDATEQQAADFVNRICAEGWHENKNFILSAEVKQTREFAGCIGVTGLSWVGLAEQLAWVGYWTAQDQRRKGYTAEALQALARWAFTDLKLDRLKAIVEDGNEASLACAVKAGFRVEGKLRSLSSRTVPAAMPGWQHSCPRTSVCSRPSPTRPATDPGRVPPPEDLPRHLHRPDAALDQSVNLAIRNCTLVLPRERHSDR